MNLMGVLILGSGFSIQKKTTQYLVWIPSVGQFQWHHKFCRKKLSKFNFIHRFNIKLRKFLKVLLLLVDFYLDMILVLSQEHLFS